MPGRELSFRCLCGFHKKHVMVGATLEGHYLVVMCCNCHLIFSLWQEKSDSSKMDKPRACKECGQSLPMIDEQPTCRKCGKPLARITDPGAWSHQARFPNYDPWLVEGKINPGNIRIRCPQCGNYSLEYEVEAFWDE